MLTAVVKPTLLLAILFALGAGTAVAGENNGYFIVVDTVSQEPGTGDPSSQEGLAISRFDKSFPKSKFVVILANSNRELREKLKPYSGKDSAVDGLYVMSHGGSPPPGELFSDHAFDSVISNKDSKLRIYLNEEYDVQDAFGPIIGKFTKGARIIFTGCRTLGMGTEAERASPMETIAKNFKLKNGSLFMMTTYSGNWVDITFAQPFYQQGNISESCAAAIRQATWPISLPA